MNIPQWIENSQVLLSKLIKDNAKETNELILETRRQTSSQIKASEKRIMDQIAVNNMLIAYEIHKTYTNPEDMVKKWDSFRQHLEGNLDEQGDW